MGEGGFSFYDFGPTANMFVILKNKALLRNKNLKNKLNVQHQKQTNWTTPNQKVIGMAQ